MEVVCSAVAVCGYFEFRSLFIALDDGVAKGLKSRMGRGSTAACTYAGSKQPWSDFFETGRNTSTILQPPAILHSAMSTAKPILHIYASSDELRKTTNDMILVEERKAVSDHGFFSIGLSGGSLVKIVSEGLRDRSDVQWDKWRVFFCDERHVSFDDQDSTYAVYKRELFDRVGLKPDNVFAINPSVTLDEAAKDYIEKIRRVYPGDDVPSFDLLLLGMGPDGHTCSLFPGHPALDVTSRLIVPVNDSPKPPPCRITMTYPVLNNANNVFVVSTGASKVDAVKRCLEPEEGVKPLPAGRVRSKELHWIMDEAASASLSQNIAKPAL